MKKVNYIAAGISALTIAGLLLPTGQVFAADINKTSAAEINITPGEIILDKVPDLNFDKIPIADLLAGNVDKPLVDNTVGNGPVKNATEAKDGNATGDLSIIDNRGTNAGWTLSAQLGQMKNDTGKTLSGSLTLKGASLTTDNPDYDQALNPTVAQTLNIGGDAVPIWNAAAGTSTTDGQGQGKNNALIKDASTILHLTKNVAVTAGKYQAAITWTLADAPK